MKIIRDLFFLILLSGIGFCKMVGPLPDILKPDNISVDDQRLYVVEGAEISIFQLKDLKFVKKFGREGEGPGELKATPFYFNKVSINSDQLMIETIDKLIYFSKDGKFIKELRKAPDILKTVPLGDKYVTMKNRINKDNKNTSLAISIYDSEMKEIKELYHQKHVQEGAPPNIKVDMIMDFLNFAVVDDKIFIEKSFEGFVIDVYDSEGKLLYKIEKNINPIKITESHKANISKKFKNDPLIKAQGGWETVKSIMKMNWFENFPPIQNIEASKNKLYVQTYNVKNNKSEYIIMDLKGKETKSVFIPWFANTPIMSKMLGAKLHTIYKGDLYSLKENEETEEWELHREEIR